MIAATTKRKNHDSDHHHPDMTKQKTLDRTTTTEDATACAGQDGDSSINGNSKSSNNDSIVAQGSMIASISSAVVVVHRRHHSAPLQPARRDTASFYSQDERRHRRRRPSNRGSYRLLGHSSKGPSQSHRRTILLLLFWTGLSGLLLIGTLGRYHGRENPVDSDDANNEADVSQKDPTQQGQNSLKGHDNHHDPAQPNNPHNQRNLRRLRRNLLRDQRQLEQYSAMGAVQSISQGLQQVSQLIAQEQQQQNGPLLQRQVHQAHVGIQLELQRQRRQQELEEGDEKEEEQKQQQQQKQEQQQQKQPDQAKRKRERPEPTNEKQKPPKEPIDKTAKQDKPKRGEPSKQPQKDPKPEDAPRRHVQRKLNEPGKETEQQPKESKSAPEKGLSIEKLEPTKEREKQKEQTPKASKENLEQAPKDSKQTKEKQTNKEQEHKASKGKQFKKPANDTEKEKRQDQRPEQSKEKQEQANQKQDSSKEKQATSRQSKTRKEHVQPKTATLRQESHPSKKQEPANDNKEKAKEEPKAQAQEQLREKQKQEQGTSIEKQHHAFSPQSKKKAKEQLQPKSSSHNRESHKSTDRWFLFGSGSGSSKASAPKPSNKRSSSNYYKKARPKNNYHPNNPHNETAVICAIQRAEERYLDEWVHYHLGLGFERIYLYDNSQELQYTGREPADYDLPPDSMMTATATADGDWSPPPEYAHRVTIIEWPGEQQQHLAYSDCAQRVHLHHHTWAAFLDIDEYWVLKRHNHILDFARDHAPRGLVAVNWQLVGTLPKQVKLEEGPVTLRFSCLVESRQNLYVKSLVRIEDLAPSVFEWSRRRSNNTQDDVPLKSPHIFPLREGVSPLNTNGLALLPGMSRWEDAPRSVATVYHYYYKSREEFVGKHYRGDAVYGGSDSKDKINLVTQHGIDPKTQKPLPVGYRADYAAWKALERVAPEYVGQFATLLNKKALEHSINGDTMCTDPYPKELLPKQTETVALCTMHNKRDTIFLEEWLDYHLELGFSDVYMMDNELDDFDHLKDWKTRRHTNLRNWWARWRSHHKTISKDPKTDLPRVHIIDNPGRNVTTAGRAATNECMDLARTKNHTYVLWLDINEFLVVKDYQEETDQRSNQTILDFIRAIDESTSTSETPTRKKSLGFSRYTFGTAGRTIYEDFPVTQRFPCRLKVPDPSKRFLLEVQDVDKVELPTWEPSFYKRQDADATRQQGVEATTATITPDLAAIHYYPYRSLEDLRRHLQSRHPNQLPLPPVGSIRDEMAWQQMKRFVPSAQRKTKSPKSRKLEEMLEESRCDKE